MSKIFNEDIKKNGLKKSDLFLAWLTGHTIIAVMNYRIAAWMVRHKIRVIPQILSFRTKRRYGLEISPMCQIGGGLRIIHSQGITIGWNVRAGCNLELFQHVTIGSNRKELNGRSMPVIGNNVSIGNGAIVVGPINIGNNVIIGANSYVDKDIPDNSFVIGTSVQIRKS